METGRHYKSIFSPRWLKFAAQHWWEPFKRVLLKPKADTKSLGQSFASGVSECQSVDLQWLFNMHPAVRAWRGQLRLRKPQAS